MWANYVDAMKQAGFSAGQGLYIASGLLTYGANDGAPCLSISTLHCCVADASSDCSCCCPFAEMDHLVATLKQSGLCKTAHYKELYLPQAEIEGELSLSNRLPLAVGDKPALTAVVPLCSAEL